MFGSADARRSALYRQLASLEDAGIPLRNAIERVVAPEMNPVGRALDDGLSPGDAWARAARFTPLEVSLVKAGAKSGQLSENFSALSAIYEESATAKRALMVGLAYPFILIHLAFLLPRLSLLISHGLYAYAMACLLPLAALYVVVGIAIVLGKAFAATSPAAAAAILQRLPIFGAMLTRQALVLGLGTLVAVYKAGLPITEAADSAASAAGFFPVREGFRRIRERLDAGESIGDAFLAEKTFPEEVRESASVGAATGKLDEQLLHARRRLESEAKAKKGILLVVLPIIAFLLVAAVVGYSVISQFKTMILDPLDEAMK